MNRFARRLLAAVAVSLAGILAVVTPAQAEDVQVTLTWMGHPADYVVMQLNDEAVQSTLNYSSGLGWGLDDMCTQVDDYLNGKRAQYGYTDSLSHDQCVSIFRDCVDKIHPTSNRVQISVYADLSHGCSTY